MDVVVIGLRKRTLVIVKLQGGLGNQMFQYAAGRSLTVPKQKVLFDQSFLKSNTIDSEGFTSRHFELGIFKNLNASDAGPWEIDRALSRRSYNKLLDRIPQLKYTTYQQYGNELVDLSSDTSKRVYLIGYFQSEKYFSHIQHELKKEFEFPMLGQVNNNFKKKIFESENPVSIHIRRGDYIKSELAKQTHGLIPPEFYYLALEKLRERHQISDIFVFSDDIPWAKANINIGDLNFIYVNVNHGKDSWKDMALMSMCKHHIIANSSFSWWGAWLSTRGGEVYAPKNWFNPQFVQFNIDDFIPEKWTVLSYD